MILNILNKDIGNQNQIRQLKIKFYAIPIQVINT